VTEAWLRGPVAGVDPLLMPAVHALMHAREEIEASAPSLTVEQLWTRPGGSASVGFHIRHIANSIDRMLTYARGGDLDERQWAALRAESTPGKEPVAALIDELQHAIDRAIAVMRATPTPKLHEKRTVGRKALPTTVFGILFHIGEHSARHAGQVVTLSKVVRG
jgi:uncharacterized damage-inducible protein DinB